MRQRELGVSAGQTLPRPAVTKGSRWGRGGEHVRGEGRGSGSEAAAEITCTGTQMMAASQCSRVPSCLHPRLQPSGHPSPSTGLRATQGPCGVGSLWQRSGDWETMCARTIGTKAAFRPVFAYMLHSRRELKTNTLRCFRAMLHD